MKEIEFLTIKCRMGAATQRQYFEAKFPEQIIYDNDLYKAIQHFRSQNKDDSNDTAKLYMKLLELSQNNPIQNLIKKVQKLLGNKFQEFFTKFHAQYLINTLYNTKESWTHPWTCHQFTAGLHASSPVESINAWIKSYIFNSNISLCELGDISTTAFMFTFINQKLEEYLPPAILELQRDEICQYLEDVSNVRQITAACMISNINKDQISSINKDPSKEQFLVASKFENEITPFIPQYNVLFLTAICKTSQEFITQHEQLTDI
ncbi:unnamed protein product [Rhizophagus irregularis]|nr:unnamed protein product [Rhizophagus irregularis]